MADIEFKSGTNTDSAYVDGHKVRLIAIPDGTLELPISATRDSGYVVDGNGKKHKVLLATFLTQDPEYKDSQTADTAYVTVDGQKVKVTLTAQLSDSLELPESATADQGYAEGEDGNKHRVTLIATPQGTLELPESETLGYGYIVDNSGNKHRVKLLLNVTGGQYTIVRGISPLSLPDAVADSLQYVKAFGGSAYAGVPAEYDVLSYIEGTANVQYINTGIVPNSSMNMYSKMQVVSSVSGYTNIFFGARDTITGGQGVDTGYQTSAIFFDWFGMSTSDRYTFSITKVDGDIVEHTVKNSNVEIKVNGTSIGTHQFTPTGTITQPLYINGLNNGGTPLANTAGVNRVYRFAIAGIADFIPARRKSDGVVGMYDIIRKQFFTNAGTGSFTAGSVVENLPSEYTQLEYVESTGSQYIDTGFKPNQDSGFVIDYYADSTQQPRVFMIAQNLNDLSYGFGIVLGRGANIAVYNGERRDTAYWKCDDFTGIGRYIVNVNKTAAYIEDSTGARVSYTYPSDTFQLEYNLCLFTLNNTGEIVENTSSVRVYSFKIYDNGTLVRNFIPAKRNSNSEIGMYDLVNHQFYTNPGTGNFVAGAEVNPLVPSPALPLDIVCNNGTIKPLRQIEYITTMGTQYIDTGVVGDLDTEYEITVKSNVTPTAGGTASYAAFGSRTSETENNIMSTYTLSANGLGIINDFGDYNVTRQLPTISATNILHRYTITNSKSKRTITDLDTGWTDTVTTEYSGSLTTPTNLYIGYAGSLGGLASVGNLRGNIYGCKIWKSGALVRDFVPAIDPKGVVCLFDKVEGKYYYNAGTGNFIPSEDAHVQELEYLESTGTQYINTGVKTGLGVAVEAVLKVNSQSNQVDYSGATYTMNGGWMRFGSDNSNSLGAYFSVNEKRGASIPFDNNFHTYYISNGLQKVDDTTADNTISTMPTTLNMYLFRANTDFTATIQGKQTIKSCKIWDNGTLVRDFVPARRLADNVLGMWDKVNKVFYTNAGTGTFVAGPAIYTEPDYTVIGTTETIVDSLSNSATAEDLFALIGLKDEQEILSGNVIHKVGVKILTGSEDWTTESTWFKADILEPSAHNSLLCTHFERRVITQDNSVFKNADSSVLMVHYSACSTVDSFKEWLRNQYEAGQPVIVLYPLVTPTAESVAGQTLQVADGDNTLTITQASLPDLELEAKYKKTN